MRSILNLFRRRDRPLAESDRTVRDPIHLLAMDIAGVRRVAVREAIETLGLLQPEAVDTVVALMDPESGQHPRATGTAFRKLGEQLTAPEKKALGIRANAMMSRQALSQLTEKGREKPIAAHETTLLRASFTMVRHRDLLQFQRLGRKSIRELRYDMLPPVCKACEALNGTMVTVETAHLLPHPGCECDTANYGIRAEIDWLADID